MYAYVALIKLYITLNKSLPIVIMIGCIRFMFSLMVVGRVGRTMTRMIICGILSCVIMVSAG